jgi:phosphatidylserine decarboxylase
MILHKEGFSTIGLTAVLILIINWAGYTYLPEGWFYFVVMVSAVFFLTIVQFFRVPGRVVTAGNNLVIAPCDGKVVVIEETVETEYFKGPRRQVSIFMSPLNVHVNWNPVSGIVKYFRYHPGKYLVAWHPKSSTDNERTTTVIRTESGEDILFRQIAGALARRIRWYVKEGQEVEQSTQMGFIKFGSRVDVYLPLDAEIMVNLEEKTTGSVTVLAKLK